MKYFVLKLLTNDKGQDGSKIDALYENEDPEKAKEAGKYGFHSLCATLHHASDVLYAVVQLLDEYGHSEEMDIIDHRPAVVPEATDEPTETTEE
jgi:hypothetical protein